MLGWLPNSIADSTQRLIIHIILSASYNTIPISSSPLCKRKTIAIFVPSFVLCANRRPPAPAHPEYIRQKAAHTAARTHRLCTSSRNNHGPNNNNFYRISISKPTPKINPKHELFVYYSLQRIRTYTHFHGSAGARSLVRLCVHCMTMVLNVQRFVCRVCAVYTFASLLLLGISVDHWPWKNVCMDAFVGV